MASSRKKPVARESGEQRLFLQWLAMRYPDVERMTFHVPNGGHRDIRVAVNLKRDGVKAGVPDLFIMVPKGGFHGCVIEMKAASKSPKTTKAQRDWLERLNANGYLARVCAGFREAKQVIDDYMELPEVTHENHPQILS